MARGRSQAEEPEPKVDPAKAESERTPGGRVAPAEGEGSMGASAAGTESPSRTGVAEGSDPDNEKAPNVSTVMPAQYDVADEDIIPVQSRD